MPYKQAPKSMALKALIGKQKNLPEALKAKILEAPETPAKQIKVIAQKTTIDKKTGKKTVEKPKELATEKITAEEFFRNDGSYDPIMFPPIEDYGGNIVTPGYDPEKAADYKDNAKKAKPKK